jgi:hypothetical protein
MMIHVGKVEQIVFGMRRYICACCSLNVANCKCDHDKEHFNTSCPRRKSTF